MLLKNVTQDLVLDKLDEMLKKDPELCQCEKCRLDIAAIALNNLPPRYVVTDRGGVFERLSGLNIQINADTVRELSKAIVHVRKNPQHEKFDNHNQ